MTYLEKVKLCENIRNHRMKWGIRKYENRDGTLNITGYNRYLSKEQTARINSGIERTANEMKGNGKLHESGELKDWQWEIMLENESKDENRG